jgi:hypothetical protein
MLLADHSYKRRGNDWHIEEYPNQSKTKAICTLIKDFYTFYTYTHYTIKRLKNLGN